MNIFRCDTIDEMILNWKVNPNNFQFDECVSLNFDYHEDSLSIPQLAMTSESNIKLNFDSPIGCLFVMIGGKYSNRVGDVMEKVNYITKDVGGIRPLAVFLMNSNIKENVYIDVRYGSERYKHSPAMVNNLIIIFIWNILLFYIFKLTLSVLD